MVEVNGLKISISRGDTGSVTINFTGQDAPADGVVALVVLQKTQDSEKPIWEKEITIEDSKAVIAFRTEDTRNLSRGKYCWCLRLLYPNGDIYTPMRKPQEFEVLPANGEPGDDSGG